MKFIRMCLSLTLSLLSILLADLVCNFCLLTGLYCSINTGFRIMDNQQTWIYSS